ncbi:MAG: hypothetical protein OXF74_07930 [Rhodobacteraceae bacterium]|nr:hypothetical protein [Paracoccaceae bacterium]
MDPHGQVSTANRASKYLSLLYPSFQVDRAIFWPDHEWSGWDVATSGPDEWQEEVPPDSAYFKWLKIHSHAVAIARPADFFHRITVALSHRVGSDSSEEFTEIARNFSVIPERTNLKAQIEELLSTAGSDNWDGENAQAVSEETVKVALEVAGKLPANIKDPDVAATPHGEVDFDWMASRDAMLTISIGSDGTLAWAALFGEFKSRGTAPWTGKLVCPVECCLHHYSSL